MSESFQKQFKEGLSGLIGGVSLSEIKAFDISFPSFMSNNIPSLLSSTKRFANMKVRANVEKNPRMPVSYLIAI